MDRELIVTGICQHFKEKKSKKAYRLIAMTEKNAFTRSQSIMVSNAEWIVSLKGVILTLWSMMIAGCLPYVWSDLRCMAEIRDRSSFK